uniref:Putative secreted protein n=1 Tax=Anopheles darlingi TaxID=43151 RepID=A0A2M4D1K7_ANODA
MVWLGQFVSSIALLSGRSLSCPVCMPVYLPTTCSVLVFQLISLVNTFKCRLVLEETTFATQETYLL